MFLAILLVLLVIYGTYLAAELSDYSTGNRGWNGYMLACVITLGADVFSKIIA